MACDRDPSFSVLGGKEKRRAREELNLSAAVRKLGVTFLYNILF